MSTSAAAARPGCDSQPDWRVGIFPAFWDQFKTLTCDSIAEPFAKFAHFHEPLL